jgi:hypothetical protein
MNADIYEACFRALVRILNKRVSLYFRPTGKLFKQYTALKTFELKDGSTTYKYKQGKSYDLYPLIWGPTFRKVQIMILNKDFNDICDSFIHDFVNNSSVAPRKIYNLKNTDKAVLFAHAFLRISDVYWYQKPLRSITFLALKRFPPSPPPSFDCPFCRANVSETQPVFLDTECQICYENNKMNRLSCGHLLCDKCINALLNEQS